MAVEARPAREEDVAENTHQNALDDHHLAAYGASLGLASTER